MVLQIRDQYVGNPDYGLDKYLSVRIRHGTFTAHLRSPIEDARLITSKDLGGSGYRPNEYWPAQLLPYDAWRRQELSQRLTDFSSAYDELLDRTKALLTVSKDAKGAGLFGFGLTPRAVSTLEAVVVHDDTSCEVFVDRVISLCDELLEDSLTRIRELLARDFKDQASLLLDQLSADVESFGTNASTLVNAIGQASVALRVTADRVQDWFSRSAGAMSEPFTLDEAVEISRQAALRISRGFVLESETAAVEGLRFKGVLMFPLIDVLFIVMDNVIKHSGIYPRPIARLRAWRGEGCVRIRCENPLGPGISAIQVRKRFDARMQAAGSTEGAAAVAREGGTGLYKLARIVSNDLAAQGEYEFGVDDKDVAFVEVAIPDALMVSR
jgi:hypothetical protein